MPIELTVLWTITMTFIVCWIYFNLKFYNIKEINKLLLEWLKVECKYSMMLEKGKEKLLLDLIDNPEAWKKFKKYFLKR